MIKRLPAVDDGMPDINVGHGPSIATVRAGNACTDQQARNHRAHRNL